MKLISEFWSDDKSKKAEINLLGETLQIDFFEDGKYNHTIRYPSKSFRYVEDAAENYALGIFKNYKDFSEV